MYVSMHCAENSCPEVSARVLPPGEDGTRSVIVVRVTDNDDLISLFLSDDQFEEFTFRLVKMLLSVEKELPLLWQGELEVAENTR